MNNKKISNKNEQFKVPFDVNLIISHRNNKPCLEIRRVTTNLEVIKNIISCAFHDRPIIVYPMFTNRIKAIGMLMEKGILYKEGDEYFFSI